MRKKIIKEADSGNSIRINLVLSDRRDRELFNELKRAPVNDRASIFKHLSIIGLYCEKGSFADADKQHKPKSKSGGRVTKEPVAEVPTLSAKQPSAEKKTGSSEINARGYSSNDMGGAEDLGLNF